LKITAYDVVVILQKHAEGVSTPSIVKGLANGVSDKRVIISIHKKVLRILYGLSGRGVVERLAMKYPTFYKLTKKPYGEVFLFKCPKCQRLSAGELGKLITCKNRVCMRKNGVAHTRYWAYSHRLIIAPKSAEHNMTITQYQLRKHKGE